MEELKIHHVQDTRPAQFHVEFAGYTSTEPVVVPSPLGFPVEGRPESDLLIELQWYLEDFLDYPYSPHTDRAHNILRALSAWAKQASNVLFCNDGSKNLIEITERDGYENLRVQIVSDDPRVLHWPWEALSGPDGNHLFSKCSVERRLKAASESMPVSSSLPADIINILLITPRPFAENDVSYGSISRPLVELIEKKELPARVHVLRPPTTESLKKHLSEKKDFFHIIHFDGHGDFENRVGVDPEGVLLFEKNDGSCDKLRAEEFSDILKEYSIPSVVLNACRSSMTQQDVSNPFASVAASVIKAGVRCVVAMSYSLNVSAAKEFLPAFYEKLFETGDFAKATLHGRIRMKSQKKRICARGKYDLDDYLVPVLFQQTGYTLAFAGNGGAYEPIEKVPIPHEAMDETNPLEFIGRDREIFDLERAIRGDAPVILIEGMAGVGKTTLSRGFLKWLVDTQGIDIAHWINLIGVRSAEFVINSMGTAIFTEDFLYLDMSQKLENLASAISENRIFVFLDNFEAICGIPESGVAPCFSEDDRKLLKELIEKISGGTGKIIITSRSEEDWLDEELKRISIGGLIGEERWEYLDALLNKLDITTDRDDENLSVLINMLHGHPFSMRVVIPMLNTLDADNLIAKLQESGLEDDMLTATMKTAVERLYTNMRSLLIPLSMHEGFVYVNLFRNIVLESGEDISQEVITEFMRILSVSGILRNISGPKETFYELHPAASGFFKAHYYRMATTEILDKWSHAFVLMMTHIADQMAPLPAHRQWIPFFIHGSNIRNAIFEAERLNMEWEQAYLLQTLAINAFNARNFTEAIRIANRMEKISISTQNEGMLATVYNKLGMIAYEQRKFPLSKKYFLKAVSISEKLRDEFDIALIYGNLGSLEKEQRNYSEAEKCYLKSIALFEKIGDEDNAAVGYQHMGIVAQYQKDYVSAKRWSLKSVAIKKRKGDDHGLALSYHQLGRISEEQGDYGESWKWYVEALSIYEELEDEYNAAKTYLHLGRIVYQEGDFSEAEEFYLKALEVFEEQSDEHGSALIYHQMGLIAQKQRDFTASDKWALKAIAIFEKLGDELSAALTYGLMGVVMALQDDYKQSGKWIIKALGVFYKTDETDEFKKNFYNFYLTYRKAPLEHKAALKTEWEEILGNFPDVFDKGIDGINKEDHGPCSY